MLCPACNGNADSGFVRLRLYGRNGFLQVGSAFVLFLGDNGFYLLECVRVSVFQA